MKIVKFPDPILFSYCFPVAVFGKELSVLLNSMWDTMIENKGIGLSANQVGLPYQMFVMEGPEKEKLFFVNPQIVSKSVAPANLNEGCLSAPGEFLNLLERASWVKVKFQNEKGEEKERVFKGIYSVCVQHEIDHLQGKSYLESKSLPKAKRKELAKKWNLK